MSIEKITAPFTEEQVQKLKEFQLNANYHPFTCCSDGSDEKCERKNNISQGLLIPTVSGWICPCGEVTQNWCHKFMAE